LKKKLVEVVLPLDAINWASAREKSIQHGQRFDYNRRPFGREPDFGVTSANYEIAELLDRAEEPV
jgi:hypothetical protein